MGVDMFDLAYNFPSLGNTLGGFGLCHGQGCYTAPKL
jgi:hypothetical protein